MLAFAFRVIPSYEAVFTTNGVGFQEPDAWFHMRSVHNLLAHFPFRSTFDPYAIFPGGENTITGPGWDYMVASAAWIVGFGSPSTNFIDEIGAWLPAILGALLPVPVFFFGRRLFGVTAGMFSSIWVAIIPGTFLWVGHLGMADHHAAEVLLSLLAVVALSSAAETTGKRRGIAALSAGVARAAYLATQITGIYVPGTLALVAVMCPALVSVTSMALATAALVLLPLGGGRSSWLDFMWFSLTAGLAIVAPLALLRRVARKRNWPPRFAYAAVLVTGAVVAATLAFTHKETLHSLIEAIQSFRPGGKGPELTSQVAELQPLWRSSPGGFGAMFRQYGMAWIVALPGIILLFLKIWRERRPVLLLFAAWSLTVGFGTYSHLRMTAYSGVVMAILAGAATAWIVRLIPSRAFWLRALTAAILISIGAATALPSGYAETHTGYAPGRDWLATLEWLRWKTPEPLGDARAWYGLWPALKPGAEFRYPATAYGIMTIWDKGWWIDGISRRIPNANGGESGAYLTSRFLTETDPSQAIQTLRQERTRYVITEPGSITGGLPSLVAMAGRQIEDYSRVLYVPTPNGERKRIRVYLPVFFQSMAARLYLFEARPVDSRTHGVQVFLTGLVHLDSGEYRDEVSSIRSFPGEMEARVWMASHSEQSALLASADPTLSCVDLEALPWISRVFSSSDETIVATHQPSVVKVFEVTP